MADLWNGLSNTNEWISDAIGVSLSNTVGRFFYMIVSAINYLLSLIFKFFDVFSGQVKVTYNGEPNFLINVFFENSTISGIYWGMALIGVILCFAFTIISVVRKMFDGAEKIQASMGTILSSTFKSVLLILSLNAVMVIVLNFTNVLMQQVTYIFNAGSTLVEEQEIDFTEDQFATMGRVLNTIGNYSLNPSYNSRYNLNSCYNEIRNDMLYLEQQGVFDFYYYTVDADGNEVETWQSALQSLVFAANLEEELKMDVYNESVSNTLLEIMDILQTNTAFYPLEHYERSPAPLNNIPFDRVMFLGCTYNAAKNDAFNENPSHTDALRGPYYNGQKSIYDFEQVSKDFDLLWGFNYIVFFVIAFGVWRELFYVLLDCVARIYNMVLLYLVAPPFIAVSPLDNGGKLKQWTLAFTVQCFGVFGTVIAMRLLIIFAPIILSTDLELFGNPLMDIYARYILLYAASLTAKKASAMVTGILADSAGWQSITAGSLRGDHDEAVRKEEAAGDRAESKADRADNKRRQFKADMKEKAQEEAQRKAAKQEKDKQQQQPNGNRPPNTNTSPKPTTPPNLNNQNNGTSKKPNDTGNPNGTDGPPNTNTTVTPPPAQIVTAPDTGVGNTTYVNNGGDGFYGIPVAPELKVNQPAQQQAPPQDDAPRDPPPLEGAN